MANLSKIKREKMLDYLEKLKEINKEELLWELIVLLLVVLKKVVVT